DKVRLSDCVKSDSLKEDILGKFDGLTIACDQKDEDCGQSHRYWTHTIHIYKPAMNPASCGPLASTILHEVIHQTEWRLFGHGETSDACERSCFGWGHGDAAKCK